MDIRDKLNSKENYQEIIEQQREYIQEELDDLEGYNPEETEKIRDTYQTLMKYSLDNLIAAYSMGEAIEVIEKRVFNNHRLFSTCLVTIKRLCSDGLDAVYRNNAKCRTGTIFKTC